MLTPFGPVKTGSTGISSNSSKLPKKYSAKLPIRRELRLNKEPVRTSAVCRKGDGHASSVRSPIVRQGLGCAFMLLADWEESFHVWTYQETVIGRTYVAGCRLWSQQSYFFDRHHHHRNLQGQRTFGRGH